LVPESCSTNFCFVYIFTDESREPSSKPTTRFRWHRYCRFYRAMTLTDFLIIYLACGSPFGVYQLTTLKSSLFRRNLTAAIASFLLWPAFACALTARHFFPYAEAGRVGRQRRSDAIRHDIEAVAFAGRGNTSSVFEFREVFYRLTGLLETSREIEPLSKGSLEIFDITRHPNKRLASRCLRRRNHLRIEHHRMLASAQFADTLAQLTDSSLKREKVKGLSLSLFTIFGKDFDETSASRYPARPPAQIDRTNSAVFDAVKLPARLS